MKKTIFLTILLWVGAAISNIQPQARADETAFPAADTPTLALTDDPAAATLATPPSGQDRPKAPEEQSSADSLVPFEVIGLVALGAVGLLQHSAAKPKRRR
jgi:hypothetical protein